MAPTQLSTFQIVLDFESFMFHTAHWFVLFLSLLIIGGVGGISQYTSLLAEKKF